MVLLLTAPPAFGVPSLFDAFLGWLVGLIALIAPSAWLAMRSHTVLGHWSRHFAQWRRRAWWAVTLGSIGLGSGILTLLGALPAWQTRWRAWYLDAQARDPADLASLAWLNQTQTEYAHVLQIAAIVISAGALVLLLLGMWRMHHRVLTRRVPVAPTSDWMMAPPLTRAHVDG